MPPLPHNMHACSKFCTQHILLYTYFCSGNGAKCFTMHSKIKVGCDHYSASVSELQEAGKSVRYAIFKYSYTTNIDKINKGVSHALIHMRKMQMCHEAKFILVNLTYIWQHGGATFGQIACLSDTNYALTSQRIARESPLRWVLDRIAMRLLMHKAKQGAIDQKRSPRWNFTIRAGKFSEGFRRGVRGTCCASKRKSWSWSHLNGEHVTWLSSKSRDKGKAEREKIQKDFFLLSCDSFCSLVMQSDSTKAVRNKPKALKHSINPHNWQWRIYVNGRVA